ncbi:MAG: hypothetical protein IPK82_15130 [Polyangiaceae bacterium]|nr:hypothetical protein [Polyangiaceae bacterium]
MSHRNTKTLAFLITTLLSTTALAQPAPSGSASATSAPSDPPPAPTSAPPAPQEAAPAGSTTSTPATSPAPTATPTNSAPAAAPKPIAPPSDDPPVDPDLPRPFVAHTHGFSIWPLALVQAQAAPYVGKNSSFLAGDIAEHPGFRIRRARLGVAANYESLLKAEIQAELLTNAQVTLLLNQAWVGVTPKSWFGAYMGMLDVPFSRSSLSPAADTALIDRPLAVRALAPNQQLGIYAHGLFAKGLLQYYLGVYNGFQRFDQFYSGYRQPQAGFGNRFDNLAYAARLASSLLTPGEEIPTVGDRKPRLNLGASYFYSDGGARDIHSINGDVFFQHSGFRAVGEVLYSSTIPESVPTQPTSQTANIDSFGVVLEAGYTFRKMAGAHLRFELIDPNTAVQDASDNWLLTVGLSFNPPVLGKYCRAQFEYTHREELYGAALENDSVAIQTQFMLQ